MNYSSAGAPTGHASAQEPQLTQSSALITYLPSPSAMQPVGQASTQAPQLMHSSEILYAIVMTSIFDIQYNSNAGKGKNQVSFAKKSTKT
jgi:hypothetical protein